MWWPVSFLLLVLYCWSIQAYNSYPFSGHLSEPVLENGTRWVVLAAGGTGWGNYRHQSNVYHTYQVIRSHGIPDKNIIVMHYDDLAYNKANPTPGIVVNKLNGSDVYKGVPKDFTGNDVNPLNFLAVLRGDPVLARNGKKVVNSGPNDYIYVYFIDHGSDDLIAFPHQYLYGEELNDQLRDMFDKKRYAKMVLNIEACNSGSMFEKLLPQDINVWVTTSANPMESSYACDYDPLRKTYLGDYYSGTWIENIESQDLDNETLIEMYEYIKVRVNISHPQAYGDGQVAKMVVSKFLGNKPKNLLPVPTTTSSSDCHPVKSQDMAIHLAEMNYRYSASDNERRQYLKQLDTIVKGRHLMDKHFERYVQSIIDQLGSSGTTTTTSALLNDRHELTNRKCYRQLVDMFHQQCFNLNQNPYGFSKLKIFVNICEQLVVDNVLDIQFMVNSLKHYCQQNVVNDYTNIE
ncbi:legumain-like [Oppia nitens]|uniref:legumain-like n=1 Tax=Oppia nitens TaxID=1686743 RepID=UPI0023DA4424|nr:legumain-like [Oppia nitens]